MGHRVNIERIRSVFDALGKLAQECVFVGGATVSLYADRIAEEVRPTDDVDILVEIGSLMDFTKLEEKIRDLGFQNDMQAKFIGRYKLRDIIIDLMPTDVKILGFSNKWYSEGFKKAIHYSLDKTRIIKILEPPYFLATKIEAFKNRGNDDGRTSSDFEDMVFVLENRDAVWEEISSSNDNIKQYLRNEFLNFLKIPYFEEWIEVHTVPYSSSTTYIVENIKEFLDFES